MEPVVELLGQLVAIDSVNPSLVAGAAGEAEIARFVASWADRAGLRVETVGKNVIVRSRGTSERRLLLCGHLDTVGFGGMTDPLVPRIEGNRMYGRGTYDMKAGLAAALIACAQSSGDVTVAAVADEEYASEGIQEVLPYVQADAAIVCEPTELAVGTAHKGFVWSEIEIHGKAAHGSRPHLGVDAILGAGPILVALADLDRELRNRTHPLLGSGNLHGSLITGGTEEPTIPDRCVVTVERRILPDETVAEVEEQLAALLRRVSDLDVDTRTTLARLAMETPADSPIVEVLRTAAKEVTGTLPSVVGASYWADSAFIAAAGIPSVLYGPGGEGAHAEVEWVSIPDTIACARALTAAAQAFCR